ncbi:MAG: helix-turn-helix transcriptional regulator [Elusimicrobia bacterium]|nr:helix-turn-helix transcriptional regulator [Elusimicrobiota bacterium]
MSNIHTKEYQVFLERLKSARLEAGLTQAGVAKILKKPQSYVSKCEMGERRVDVVDLQRMARIYKKELMTFFP